MILRQISDMIAHKQARLGQVVVEINNLTVTLEALKAEASELTGALKALVDLQNMIPPEAGDDNLDASAVSP